jgi:hypothetical protein
LNVVYLYGPPAVGKLTVAQDLARQTGYRLFHNHLTVDVATAIFEQGSAPYHRLVDRLRLNVFEAAQSERLPGLIFTKVWDPARTDEALAFIRSIEALGCTLCFVRLFCTPEALDQRVLSPERRRYGKIIQPGELRAKLDQLQGGFIQIPGRECLSIDTTSLTPNETAQQIAAEAAKLIKSAS